MKRTSLLVTGAALAVLVSAGGVGIRVWRGSVGEVVAAGPVPELSSQSPERWVNGAPVSLAGARGDVVFVEGWSPG